MCPTTAPSTGCGSRVGRAVLSAACRCGGLPRGNSSIRPKNKAPLAETLKLNGYSTAQFGKCHEPLAVTLVVERPTKRPSCGTGSVSQRVSVSRGPAVAEVLCSGLACRAVSVKTR